jgi:hypothetical protein
MRGEGLTAAGYSTGSLGDRRAIVARAEMPAGADPHHCMAVAERPRTRRNRLQVVAGNDSTRIVIYS